MVRGPQRRRTQCRRIGCIGLRPVLPSPTPRNDPPKKNLGPAKTAAAPVSHFSAPGCTNRVWNPLRPVSVAEKTKLSTMMSSNVQSIDLLMDCMA